MIDIIPPQFRLAAIAFLLTAISGGSALTGFKIATWRSDAQCASTIAILNGNIAELKVEISGLDEAIAKANSAIDVAKAQSDVADMARREAEKHAAELAELSASRVHKLEESAKNAASCAEVLTTYWDLRR